MKFKKILLSLFFTTAGVAAAATSIASINNYFKISNLSKTNNEIINETQNEEINEYSKVKKSSSKETNVVTSKFVPELHIANKTVDGVFYKLFEKNDKARYWEVESLNDVTSKSLTLKSELDYNGINYPVTSVYISDYISKSLEELIIPESVTGHISLYSVNLKKLILPNNWTELDLNIEKDLLEINIPASPNAKDLRVVVSNNHIKELRMPKAEEWCWLRINQALNLEKLVVPDNCNFSSFDWVPKITKFIIPPKTKLIFDDYIIKRDFFFLKKIFVPITANWKYSNFIFREYIDVQFYDPATYTYNPENLVDPIPINKATSSDPRIREFDNIMNQIFSTGELILPEGVILKERDFYCVSRLTKVILNSTISEIAASCFSGNYITEIHIPSNVKRIKNNFFSCHALSKITIDEGLESMNVSLKDSPITELVLPASLHHIDNMFLPKNFKKLTIKEGSPLINTIQNHKDFPAWLNHKKIIPGYGIEWTASNMPEVILKETNCPIYDIDLKYAWTTYNYEYYLMKQNIFNENVKITNLTILDFIFQQNNKLLIPVKIYFNDNYYNTVFSNPLTIFQPWDVGPNVFDKKQLFINGSELNIDYIEQTFINVIHKKNIKEIPEIFREFNENDCSAKIVFEHEIKNNNLILKNINFQCHNRKLPKEIQKLYPIKFKVFNDVTVPLTEQKKPTNIKSPINAIDLNLNTITAKEASSRINNNFILTNKSVFFTGDNKLNQTSQIQNINVQVTPNNQINLSFSLAPNTWYQQNGSLGSTSKTFTTTITGFKKPITYAPTTPKSPLLASVFNWQNTFAKDVVSQINNDFIIVNKELLFVGNLEKLTQPSQISNLNVDLTNPRTITIDFNLNEGSWYQQDGLGSGKKHCTIIINNFKELFQPTQIINPISAASVGLNTNLQPHQVINQITPDFIFSHKAQFFTGKLDGLTQVNQIIDLSTNFNHNSITLNFKLANGAWYNEYGLGEGVLSLTTVINGFASFPSQTTTSLIKTNINTAQEFNEIFGAGKFFLIDWINHDETDLIQKLKADMIQNHQKWFANSPIPEDNISTPPPSSKLQLSIKSKIENKIIFTVNYPAYDGNGYNLITKTGEVSINFTPPPSIETIQQWVKTSIANNDSISSVNATNIVSKHLNKFLHDIPDAYLPADKNFTASMFDSSLSVNGLIVSLKNNINQHLNGFQLSFNIVIPPKTTLKITNITEQSFFNEVFGSGKFFLIDWTTKTNDMNIALKNHIQQNKTTWFDNFPSQLTTSEIQTSYNRTEGNKMFFNINFKGYDGNSDVISSFQEELTITFKQQPTLNEIQEMVKNSINDNNETVDEVNALAIVANHLNQISNELPDAFLPPEKYFETSMFSKEFLKNTLFIKLNNGINQHLEGFVVSFTISINDATILKLKEVKSPELFNEIFGNGKMFVEDWINKTEIMSQKLKSHILANPYLWFSNPPSSLQELTVSYSSKNFINLNFNIGFKGYDGTSNTLINFNETITIIFKKTPSIDQIASTTKASILSSGSFINEENAIQLVSSYLNLLSDEIPDAFLPRKLNTNTPTQFNETMFAKAVYNNQISVALNRGVNENLDGLIIDLPIVQQSVSQGEDDKNRIIFIVSIITGSIGLLLLILLIIMILKYRKSSPRGDIPIVYVPSSTIFYEDIEK